MSLLKKKDKSETNEPKKEKKKGRILKRVLIGVGAFFGVIILLFAIVIMLNWDNVQALYQALTNDTEAIEKEIRESDKKFAKEVKDYLKDNLREYSEEEKREIESGEKTEMQIIAKIISENFEAQKNGDNKAENSGNEQKPAENGKNEETANPEKPNNVTSTTENPNSGKPATENPTPGKLNQLIPNQITSNQITSNQGKPNQGKPEQVTPNQGEPNQEKPNQEKPSPEKPNQESAEDILARHVANLYSYQASFEGRVSALAGSVKAYVKSYKSTHPNVSWTEAKTAAVSKYMSQASQIESECYAKVDAEIAALESDLKKIGADLSIVSTVAASAEKTMQLKKSKIMSQYMDKMK